MTNPPEFGEPDPTCPLCLRPIPPDVPQSLHHLVPRLKGGKGGPVVRVRQACGAYVANATTGAGSKKRLHEDHTIGHGCGHVEIRIISIDVIRRHSDCDHLQTEY
jgi:hypothetical protein